MKLPFPWRDVVREMDLTCIFNQVDIHILDIELYTYINNFSMNNKIDELFLQFVENGTFDCHTIYIFCMSHCYRNITYVQVNPFSEHLFLHQLTHNMTKDCSWNYHENYKRRTWAENLLFSW